MPYEVVITPPAERDLDKLDPPIARRIREDLIDLAQETDPRRYVKQLQSRHKPPFFALRVGDYRVVLQIHNGQMLIVVIEIGPRETVYRKF